MAKPVDLELKKAFITLQVKMIETSKKIHEIDSEINAVERVIKQVTVNSRGLSELPDGTRTYEAVGRIFLLQDMGKLKNKFEEREEELKLRVKDLKDNKEYLEKNLKESENNIREMVQLRKEQAEVK